MARRKSKDYVARRRGADADDIDESPHALKWWLSETGLDAQSKLWTWVGRLANQWSVDAINDLIHEAIYADEPIARGGMFDGYRWTGGQSGGTCILNVIKSLVDTSTARLTKVRTMPCISAKNADYMQQKFAEEVSEALRTKMGGQDIETASPLVIRDGNIRGTGVWKTQRNGGDTQTIRVPIYEIVHDRREAQALASGPTSMAHVRPENRDAMIARYPRFADEIRAAQLYTRIEPWMQFVYQGPTLCDLIEVAEAWHPPLEPGEQGQHIVCIRGTCILREPWLVPRYPLTFQYWTSPMRGVRGKGLVAEHTVAQEFINEVLNSARRNIKATEDLIIIAQRGANINKHHMLAGGGPRIVEADGPPGQVQYIAPDPVSKQAWEIAMRVKGEMYAVSGVSEWSATANKPLGQNASGKALETMNDNQSDRFADVETGLSQARVAIGRAHVDMAQHMYAEAHGKLYGKKSDYDEFDESPDPLKPDDLAPWIGDHEWSEIDLDSGSYQLTLEPVNFIGGTRGGRFEEAAELAKAGLIPDPTMTASLFQEPDIQAMNRPILGPINRIKMCLSGLAKPSVEYMTIAPDSAMNLPLAKLLAKGELEQAKADKAPDEVIERFSMFLSDIKAQEDNAAKGAGMSPSLAGAQASTTIDQGNAATLQGMGGGAPPMPPAGGMPPGMPPQGPPGPGMMQ